MKNENENNNNNKWNYKTTVITALFTLILGLATAWLTYNQNTKDKMTDFKIEQLRIENDEKIATNNRHIAIIHGEMWELLHKLDANHATKLAPAATTQGTLRNLTAISSSAVAQTITRKRTCEPCSTATSR